MRALGDRRLRCHCGLGDIFAIELNPLSNETLLASALLVEDDDAQASEVVFVLKYLESRLHIVDDDQDAVETVAEDPSESLILVTASAAGCEASDVVHRLRDSSGKGPLEHVLRPGSK